MYIFHLKFDFYNFFWAGKKHWSMWSECHQEGLPSMREQFSAQYCI